jgi:hypothetical protein
MAWGLTLVACRDANPPAIEASHAESVPEAGPTPTEVPVTMQVAAPLTTALAPAPAPAPACTDPCTPRTLATGDHPRDLHVDATRVYFRAGEQLRAVSRAGGPSEVLAEDIRELSTASDELLIGCRKVGALDFDLLAVPKAGGSPRVLARAAACSAAIVGDDVYFSTRDASFSTSISRAALAGGPPQVVHTPPRGFDDIAADDAQVFWSGGDGIHRLDPTTRVSTRIHDASTTEFGLTENHVVWIEGAEIRRRPKAGGPVEVLATYQESLSFAGDGSRVYWASNSDDGWARMDPADDTLVRYRIEGGSPSITVDGTEVYWSEWDKAGAVMALQTCGCGDDVLPREPARRDAVGPAPDDIDTFRWGYAQDGELAVQIEDLSADEATEVERLASTHTDDIPAGTAGLPARFPLGQRYRAATDTGIVTATVTGYETSAGGEGTHFLVRMAAPGIAGGALVVDAATGPKLGKLRSAKPDRTLADTYLPALQAALAGAKIPGTRRLHLAARHLQIVPGAFPGPHAVLVAVKADVPGASEDESGLETISALVFGDAAGNVTEVVYAFDRRLDHFTTEYLVDIGTDGTDEVVFGSQYYEGAYTLLLQWKGPTPTTLSLGGDGA